MTGRKALLTPQGAEQASALVAELGLDGWLLWDFREQNPLAHEMLGAGKTTRPAFALFSREGDPVLLRHAIEASAWGAWPWTTRTYLGWRDLRSELTSLLGELEAVAMEVSERSAVPALDRVPSGAVTLVASAGVRVLSSADLVTAFHSTWSRRGLEFHRQAAEALRPIAFEAFGRAASGVREGEPVWELELMEWIRTRIRAQGITDQVDCIVASGPRTSDAHYQPEGRGEALEAGSVVLIDLWGRHPDEGIPADQTWMGFLGEDPPDRVVEVWRAVRDARDAALAFLEERARVRAEVRGWEVDAAARTLLRDRGFGEGFVHRLGHSIDRDLHGSGPNLDDLETREERRLIPGVGFSVEPGVYLPGEFGMRSEVNVHWGADGPEVTPDQIQRELLLDKGD